MSFHVLPSRHVTGRIDCINSPRHNSQYYLSLIRIMFRAVIHSPTFISKRNGIKEQPGLDKPDRYLLLNVRPGLNVHRNFSLIQTRLYHNKEMLLSHQSRTTMTRHFFINVRFSAADFSCVASALLMTIFDLPGPSDFSPLTV